VQHLSGARFPTISQRLVDVWLSRFGAVYQGIVAARRVLCGVHTRVNVIAIRCKVLSL
jgi:hypothetical protein